MNMENLKNRAQFGASFSSDFRKNTWTFKMNEDYKVMAGKFAILPEKQYRQMVERLKSVRLSLMAHPDCVSGESQEFIGLVDLIEGILSEVEKED
jgi:hypothetical protein